MFEPDDEVNAFAHAEELVRAEKTDPTPGPPLGWPRRT